MKKLLLFCLVFLIGCSSAVGIFSFSKEEVFLQGDNYQLQMTDKNPEQILSDYQNRADELEVIKKMDNALVMLVKIENHHYTITVSPNDLTRDKAWAILIELND